ncbi:MAG TPA: alpha/beta hydrolase [Spirochaetota bacterium]|nr:alpha/beta hydrolase [Spirochaetota bacterium]HPI22351.1 alpha/beta hydrolase [Spirochaetota bacterium]HPU87893.1 alpha/beta hydrolase [Spirochaetota bacterium]
MTAERVEFRNGRNQRIAGRLHRADPPASAGAIFCHGLFSTKDGYKITRLADDIRAAGLTLLAFDFSFVGESEGRIEDLSIEQEVDDLACAVRFMRGQGFTRVHLIGSSMGGTVSVLYAARHADSVDSLVLIATPVDLPGLLYRMTGMRDTDRLPEEGATVVQGIAINNRFFREIGALDPRGALPGISAPVLVIHGECDDVVDPENARRIVSGVRGEARLVNIPDGDHNLVRDEDLVVIRANLIEWLRDRAFTPPSGAAASPSVDQ